MRDLVTKALDVNQAWLALGKEAFEAEGALFIRNRAHPSVRDANHVAAVTASTPEAIDRLLARVEREFAGFPHRAFQVDFRTPPEFVARLALDGYIHNDALVMLLEGELQGSAGRHDIRRVADDPGWEAYRTLHAIDWRDYRERLRLDEEADAGRQMFETHRMKSPPVRSWLAYVDGEPHAFLSSWEGPDGVGQVENLFTHPDHRHRGLATALIHHAVADARAHGAGPVVIVADPTDTPKQIYARMGFRPVAVKTTYRKEVPRRLT
jgi:ribosomal protein S18 acetylase RimI-like enzyme